MRLLLGVILLLTVIGGARDAWRAYAPPVESAVVALCSSGSAGQVFTASMYNCLRNTPGTEFNGNIDDANIKSGAGIAPSKISGTAVTLAGAESLSNKTLPSPVISGTITGTYTVGGTPTINPAISSAITPTTACASGYTRVALWCYNTNGNLSTFRAVSSGSLGSVQTVLGATWKAAIIEAGVTLKASSASDTWAMACVRPGDSAFGCSYDSAELAVMGATVHASNTSDIHSDTSQITVRLDSSGRVRTDCSLAGGLATVIECQWRVVAYLD